MNKFRQTQRERASRAFRALPLAIGLGLVSLVAAPPVYAEPVAQAQASQLVTIKGTVTDAAGEPMPGVSVVEKGTTRGVTTDINGNYSLRVRPGSTIVFSSIGMQKQEWKAVAGTHDVQLQDDNKLLDEVVVVGYGTVRKADLAGSVSVLEGKAFEAQPITEVSEALQGRVAGVNVVTDGVPGGTVRINVRGANSINKSNEPLYVVDGLVRESGLNGINPDDIQSMQILKDASSTAIYGSRGANGVVIITTKKGRAGSSQLTLDVSYGFSNATRLPDQMSTKDYAQKLTEYAGIQAVDVQQYLDGTNPGIDWNHEMFHTGTVQNYKVTFAKGTDKMQFYASANYMNHRGIVRNSEYERFAGRVNASADITDWLNVNADVSLSRGQGHGIGGLALGGYNPLWIAFNSSPTMIMQDANGVYQMDPYCTIQNNAKGVIMADNERRMDIVNAHLDLRFKILPGLTFTSSNGVDYYNRYNYGFTSTIQSPTTVSGMSNGNTNRYLLQSSNNLTYMGKFNEKHNLTATAVWEATKAETRGMSIAGSNLAAESVGWWNVKNAATVTADNSYQDWALLSGVGRVIYNFDNRYMLTGTLRADGSSRLSNNKWSWFPSIAAAWTLSNESFMEAYKPTVSNLKLRTSYGVIGNQDIAPYSTLSLMSQTQTYYGTATPVTGYWANKINDPNLKWERTKQVDVGVDAGFFNGRLDLSVDWYYKRTTDALLTTTLADYLGGSSYYVNAGEVSNTGVDIVINGAIIQGGDWNWTSSLNMSFLKNKVMKMTALEPVLYSGSMQSIIVDAAVIMKGEPIGSLYGYRWAGIDAEGYDTYFDKDGNVTRNPGADDREILGKSTPSMTMGWNNTVTYKNWSLNAFFTGAFGAKRINALRFARNSFIGNSRFVTDPDFWGQIGTTMPNPTVDNNNYIGASSKWVEKADYFRLENVTLGYDLKKDVTRFADIHLSFSIQNLFTITGYKGCNPASYSFGDAQWTQGIDTGTSPLPRTYTFGARFNF
ncbi:MAG: TonB-dependent receptor [Firmicutes bacterium]|nr:TonB-dependent receptor [Bacillota bacterium]MCM1401965.1 TonB-dependent receptor [Bacteroides sp.]MCM1477805.1 TonB-dependent receptor [Bacteroides sp.]